MVRDFLGHRGMGRRALARKRARSLEAPALPRAFFSLLVQRKEPKGRFSTAEGWSSTPRAACPSLCEGSAIVPGIFGRGILPLPKTAHILVRRPAGFTRPARHALTGAREAKAKATATAAAFRHSPAFASAPAFAPGAPSAAVATVGKPEGRRARRAAFWAGTGMCLPKIPAGDTDPNGAAVGARRPGCAFFGYFLCTSKESDAPRRARHDESSVAILRGSARSPSACA